MSVTNNDLAVMIGQLSGTIDGMKETIVGINKSLNGNGRPGLISDVGCLRKDLDSHLEESSKKSTEEKEKKEKWSGRTWALVMVVFTQLVTLLIVFLRTGSIK